MRKGADCLSKWVGESERQLRLLFDQVISAHHFWRINKVQCLYSLFVSFKFELVPVLNPTIRITWHLQTNRRQQSIKWIASIFTARRTWCVHPSSSLMKSMVWLQSGPAGKTRSTGKQQGCTINDVRHHSYSTIVYQDYTMASPCSVTVTTATNIPLYQPQTSISMKVTF